MNSFQRITTPAARWLCAATLGLLAACGGGGGGTAVTTPATTTTGGTTTTPVGTTTTSTSTTTTATTPVTSTTTTVTGTSTAPSTTATGTTTTSTSTTTTVTSPTTTTTTTTTTPSTTSTATTTASTEGCPAATKGAASGVGTVPATPIAQLPLDKRAAALAAAIGTPARLLVGLGTVDLSVVQKQGLKADIYDQYLVGVGAGAWPTYNSPSGAYVQIVAKNADCLGAVPMFTLYQMATNGENNLSGLSNTLFMKPYWDNVRLLFTQLKAYGKPALVNLEPDFWGFAQRTGGGDPTKVFAQVVQASSGDCPTQSDDIVGIAGCMVQMARKYAPNAYVGFPPSRFGDLAATEPAYMKRIGADKADFVVMQTLDRDIGCMEAAYGPAACTRALTGTTRLWDESNLTTPTFKEHLASVRSYFETIGLPVVWWQTPLGVPSATPGGTPGAFRDNRVRYFLTHASELTAAGGLGVVFSPGHPTQTTVESDGGQFRTLSGSYLAKPVALP